MELFLNRVSATLSAAVDGATVTFPLTAGQGARFGTIPANDHIRIVLLTAAGVVAEVVHVTARTGDNLTVVRGQDGTSAVSHTIGTTLEARIGKSTMTAMQQKEQKDATGGYAGLTLFALNLKNAANTFTNFLTNATTAVRTWTFPDKNITVAGTTNETHVAPALGTPTALVGTNITGTAAGLSIGGNAATATTANGLSATALAVANTWTAPQTSTPANSATTAFTGNSTTGTGVRGASATSTGVHGVSSSGTAVAGGSTSGVGVSGSSSSSTGVQGTSQTSWGGFFSNGGNTGSLSAPLVIQDSGSAAAPAHSGIIGSLWVTNAGRLFINTSGSTTWVLVGSQT